MDRIDVSEDKSHVIVITISALALVSIPIIMLVLFAWVLLHG